MSETTTTTVNEAVEAAFDQDSYSPYRLIEAVNEILEGLGIDKHLPTQMGYQYCGKGYIKAHRVEVPMKAGKTSTRQAWVVEKADAVEWATKYIAAQSK